MATAELLTRIVRMFPGDPAGLLCSPSQVFVLCTA